MTTPRNEQETIISYDRELDKRHYYSDVPKHNRKWADLVEKRTQYVEKNGTIEVIEGTIQGTVSVRKRTVMSEENREIKVVSEQENGGRKMSEEKLYVVKNDEGVWLSLDSSHESVWYTNNPTLFKDRIYAEAQSMGRKAHVVTLIEEPKKVVISKEQAEIVKCAHSDETPAGYIFSKSDDEELLMKAYVNGYTVAKEKRYLVELYGLVTTDGAKQYLTNKDGKWFASRRISGLHQDFTYKELNAAPEWAKQLNREEMTDDGE